MSKIEYVIGKNYNKFFFQDFHSKIEEILLHSEPVYVVKKKFGQIFFWSPKIMLWCKFQWHSSKK